MYREMVNVIADHLGVAEGSELRLKMHGSADAFLAKYRLRLVECLLSASDSGAWRDQSEVAMSNVNKNVGELVEDYVLYGGPTTPLLRRIFVRRYDRLRPRFGGMQPGRSGACCDE